MPSPDPDDLVRYGFAHRSDTRPSPMPDGYWTPWHVAAARIVADRERIAELEGGTGWLAQYVIDHMGGTNDVQAWVARSRQYYADVLTRAERAEAEVARLSAWSEDDVRDDFCATEETLHPLKTKRYDLYAKAQELVHNRRSKYALVDCVNALLAQRERAEAEVARLTQERNGRVMAFEEAKARLRQERDEALLQEKQQHDNAASLATNNDKLRRVLADLVKWIDSTQIPVFITSTGQTIGARFGDNTTLDAARAALAEGNKT